MQVTVEKDKCIGSGQCVLAAPDVFDQHEDNGIVLLLSGSPPEHRHTDVRTAAGLCPASAISLT